MITYYWNSKINQEVSSGSFLQANGMFVINVARGSKNFHYYTVELRDPFGVEIVKQIIPNLEKNEKFEVKIPLGNFLVRGKYVVIVRNEQGHRNSKFYFNIMSTRSHGQIFIAKHQLIARKLRGGVESISLLLEDIPDSFFLQTCALTYPGNSVRLKEKTLVANNIKGKNQKAITWYNVIQPSFLPVNSKNLIEEPDEYYVLRKSKLFNDKPGLELSLLDLSLYKGTRDHHYPIKLLQDVLIYIHSKMKYIRQTKERGLEYALRTGRGDCTEYSAFAVSMLRKLRIESRLVSGVGRSNHNNWLSHAFIEVYMYGNWIPVDVVKSPKPYLQLGNRGNLIGLSRKNWLDKENQEYKIEISSSFGIRPKFEFKRQITESGIIALPKSMRIEPKQGFLSKKKRSIKYQVDKRLLFIENLPHDTNSIISIDGDLHFGSINDMKYVYQENTFLQNPTNSLVNDKLTIVALDYNGRILDYCELKNSIVDQV